MSQCMDEKPDKAACVDIDDAGVESDLVAERSAPRSSASMEAATCAAASTYNPGRMQAQHADIKFISKDQTFL